MNKRQPKKLVYIGLGSIMLLLFVILGVFVYNQSTQNEQKDTTTTTPTKPFSPSGDKDNIPPISDTLDEDSTTTPSLKPPSTTENKDKRPHSPNSRTQSAGLHPIRFNPIFNTALLGIYLWLSSHKENNPPISILNVELGPPRTIATVVFVAAMVGYIGCFCYQHYKDMYNVAKDLGLLAGVSVMTSIFFYFEISKWMQPTQLADQTLSSWEFLKIILIYLIRRLISAGALGVAYALAAATIEHFTSNPKTKVFLPFGAKIFISSMPILASIWSIVESKEESTWDSKTKWLLWTISSCFAYTQVSWDPKLPAIGNKKIADTIGWLLKQSHLVRGVQDVYKVYHLNGGGYKVIQKSLVWRASWTAWAYFKRGPLYHLKIEKTSDTAGYTASFPLDGAELLESAFMVLLGVYGPIHPFLSDILNTAILCGASLVMIGLYIKLYLRVAKNTMNQWVELLADGLLSISGSIVAAYYLWNNNSQVAKTLIGAGSLMVFALYIIPKWLNRATTAYLDLKTDHPLLKKIADTIKRFTAFWLQPNLAVVYTAIVTGVVGMIYTYYKVLQPYSKNLLTAISIYAAALVAYWVIEVGAYCFTASKQNAAILEHISFFGAFAFTMQWLYFGSPMKTQGLALLSSLFCYGAVAFCMHKLLNSLESKSPLYPVDTPLSQWCLGRLASLKSFYLSKRPFSTPNLIRNFFLRVLGEIVILWGT